MMIFSGFFRHTKKKIEIYLDHALEAYLFASVFIYSAKGDHFGDRLACGRVYRGGPNSDEGTDTAVL